MDRGTLEAHMPYALIHHAYVELALEKQQAGVATNNHTGSTKDEGPILLSGGKDQVGSATPQHGSRTRGHTLKHIHFSLSLYIYKYIIISDDVAEPCAPKGL